MTYTISGTEVYFQTTTAILFEFPAIGEYFSGYSRFGKYQQGLPPQR